VVRVRGGPVWQALEASFARAARVLAEDGHDLILDLVLLDPTSVASWVRALHDHLTYLIGVHCDLPAAEARELARGDRFQNLARAQQSIVHAARRFYDFEVDSTSRGPHELATSIVAFVREHPHPGGISRLYSELITGV
jgi:chloramphenicol 3-O phosphotransferase